ncbi:hypothetical protein [Streptomyces sp. NPDC001820]|uniref:hypothetical protein n=1 Tax=Streptomyces sp. NPDC001820 TaxID=3364613 RepID=UPI00369B92D0
MLTSPDGKHRPELERIEAALLDRNPRRTLLYLRESPEASRYLMDLAAGTCELSHEALDTRIIQAGGTQGSTLAIDYFRAVLVSASILPLRDENLARLERWVALKNDAIADPDDRRLVTAFARWDRIAKIRRRARGKPITLATANIAQGQIAKAITFLTWLKTQNETLATCRQPIIDLWLTSDAHQGNYGVQPFVVWAVRSKFASGISVPHRPRRTFQAGSTPVNAGQPPVGFSTTSPSRPATASPVLWSCSTDRSPRGSAASPRPT